MEDQNTGVRVKVTFAKTFPPIIRFTDDQTSRECAEMSFRALKAGMLAFSELATAKRFLLDANSCKDPYSKACRFALAYEALGRAIGYQDAPELAHDLRNQLHKVGDGYLGECLELAHSSRHRQLQKSKSRTRQIAITTAALKALTEIETLTPRMPGLVGWQVGLAEKLQFWLDEAEVLGITR